MASGSVGDRRGPSAPPLPCVKLSRFSIVLRATSRIGAGKILNKLNFLHGMEDSIIDHSDHMVQSHAPECVWTPDTFWCVQRLADPVSLLAQVQLKSTVNCTLHRPHNRYTYPWVRPSGLPRVVVKKLYNFFTVPHTSPAAPSKHPQIWRYFRSSTTFLAPSAGSPSSSSSDSSSSSWLFADAFPLEALQPLNPFLSLLTASSRTGLRSVGCNLTQFTK